MEQVPAATVLTVARVKIPPVLSCVTTDPTVQTAGVDDTADKRWPILKSPELYSICIEQRRNEMSEDIKELHSRITTVQRELSTEISATETRIVSGINELKSELKIDQEFHNSKQKTLEDRIVDLEKWRYILLGAGIAGGWLLTKFGNMFEIVVK